MEFNSYQKLKILNELMEGTEPKVLAFRFDCSANDIYKLRDKCLKQKWVLKQHPKKLFTLEGQDEL